MAETTLKFADGSGVNSTNQVVRAGQVQQAVMPQTPPLINQPVISANSLIAPPKPVVLPQPGVATLPSQFVNNLQPVMQQSQQGLVKAETREAAMKDDVLNRLMNQDKPDSQGTFNNSFNSVGGEDFLKGFTDENTKLAMMQGKFRTQEQRINSTAGSKIQRGYELGELSREEAVQVGNQALVVAAMQGNLNTARQIAMDTVNFAVQDREMELQNLTAQYDALNGIVDKQTQQLVDNKRIETQRELEEIDYTRKLSNEAIMSGLASVEEMQQLSNPNLDNTAKQSLAQSIMAKAASENRNMALEDRAFDQESELFSREMELQKFMASISGGDVDTQVVDIGGRKVLINSQTGQTIADLSGEQGVEASELALTQSQESINSLNTLLTENSGLNSAVGPNALSRSTNWFTKLFSADSWTGARSNFIGKVESLRSQLTLETLVQAKAQGATFGALSDSEMKVLSSAASKLGTWAIEKDGKVIGYNASQEDFKAEMDRINNFAKLDYILKGGDPASVGVQITQDGAVWTQNSDGSMMKLRESLPKQDFNSVGKTSASKGNTPYLKTLGTITGLDGSKFWKYGLDVDLKKGDPVKSPVSGKVIASGFEKGFGNTIKIQDPSGKIWRLSHLDKLGLKPGQTIGAGQVIGLGGNTGTTYSPGGGDGSHLDITVYQNGKPIAARQVKSLLDQIRV